jgi:hypothetical protein
MAIYRRRTDNLVVLHNAVATLPTPPTGTGTPNIGKVNAPDGSGPRFVEIRFIASAAVTVAAPVLLFGNEDALAGQANATDEWNQIGQALNGGAGLTLTTKRGYSEVRELAAGYRALAIGSGVIAGGNVTVQLIPISDDYS